MIKKTILSVVLLIIFGCVLRSEIQPRFEQILKEHKDSYHHFEVWHDKETGQEFTCVYSGVDLGAAVSCFPTGRYWK